MKEIEEQVRKYYDDHLREHGFSPQGVGWKNEAAQARRFEQMLKIIKEERFSVNDLGCGTGDFFAYLLNQHYNSFTYTGYDVLEPMLNYARSKFASSDKARFIYIKTPDEIQPADYTIACGIFNLKYSMPEKDWLQYILSTIQLMNTRSEKGIAFNLLTKYSDKAYMQDHLYYGDPLYLFDYCKTNLSRNVALLHDYDEYDFTILIRK
jgi:SAM-dependent methyltransferase